MIILNQAFLPANILLPKNVDYEKWAVIACDQYTSEPEYWHKTEEIVGESPSTLKLILPEIYLSDKNVFDKINGINSTMAQYLNDGIFEEYKNSYFYIERIQSDGKLRQGIVGMIDLEQYDYSQGSSSPVRATEATVLERIPPRVKVRENACVELAHIMVLIDDDKQSVIEPLAYNKENMTLLYDTKLMQGGGSVKGYLVDEKQTNRIMSALSLLGNKENFERKYGIKGVSPLVFAMGDGNHSLATAKAFYESLKAKNPDKDLSGHPARYALAEIVNLHSDALQFEAIHRIITNADTEELIKKMTEALGLIESPTDDNMQSFKCVKDGNEKTYFISSPTSNLTVGSLQTFLDSYLKNSNAKIDYIHGADTVRRLAKGNRNIGFILPDMSKSELFPTVIKDGVLPRKTFSMGHAADKRYYIECRKIK